MQIRSVYLVLPILAVFLGLVVSASSTKSPTHDEFAHHTASGYSHLVTADFRMNPAEPPLSRLLSAIPLYFLGLKAPLDDPSWLSGDSPAFANAFFYGQKLSQDEIIFWARLPISILACLLGYFVFVWARDVFGVMGGLVSLILFVFSPDVLAHSGLATSDICVSFFFFLTLWRMWKYLRKPERLKNAVWVGIFLGASFLSKFSAILLLPILFLIVTIAGQWKKVTFRNAAVCFAVTLFTIWSGYFFEMKPLLKNTPDPEKKIAAYYRVGGEPLVRFATDVPVPLSTFVSAISSMMVTRSHGTNAYFLGEWSHGKKSWWQYYMTAFVIKATLGSLILLVIALIFVRSCLSLPLMRVMLLVPIAIFFLVTLQDKAQAGIRYFLPIYPLCFMVCGAFAAWVFKKRGVMTYVVVSLLTWHALDAVKAHPDYLSYFNAIVGGPDKGYVYLRDSNIDWGQDLRGVAKWAHDRSVTELVLGTISPVDMQKAYGISSRTLSEAEHKMPESKVYALGVHVIDGIEWVGRLKPDAVIGHSIWIYDLRGEKGRVVG